MYKIEPGAIIWMEELKKVLNNCLFSVRARVSADSYLLDNPTSFLKLFRTSQ